MKFLFIGFSEQNANLLSFLIQQNFSHIDCVYVERNLTQDLKFSLPIIPVKHKDAQGLIINLDGVGMLSYQSQHKENLIKYTKNQPTLLSTRMPIDTWQNAFLDSDHMFYLQAPYNKDTMLSVLQRLVDFASKNTSLHAISQADTIDASNDDFNEVNKLTKSTHQDGDKKQPLSNNTLTQLPNNKEQAIIENMLIKHFNSIYEMPLVKYFSKLFWQDTPFLLKASRYSLLVDAKNNLAMSSNIARVLDYFTVAKNHEQFAQAITIETLDDSEYLAHIQELEANHAKKYALNTLLWQIYQAILPPEVHTQARNLQIKVKFMPNFATLEDTPNYTQAVIASCLSMPKTLDELHTIFSELKPDNLNRIFLLAVLSKIVDMDILATPRHHDDANINEALNMQHKKQKNDGVTKAAKTGFFRRLLSKLSL